MKSAVPPGRLPAFSLIEVVLALGIIAFALVAILGMIPVALESNRASIDETRATEIAGQVFATLSSQPFEAISLCGNGINLSAADASASSALTIYATRAGELQNSPNETAYLIRLRFNNAPSATVRGDANEVQVIISNLGGSEVRRFTCLVARY